MNWSRYRYSAVATDRLHGNLTFSKEFFACCDVDMNWTWDLYSEVAADGCGPVDLTFSMELLARQEAGLNWSWDILWTDEMHDSINMHNWHSWYEENPGNFIAVSKVAVQRCFSAPNGQ